MIEGLYKLAANRNRWMACVFLAYLTFAFIFGIAYYLIYLNDRHSFAFNSDILRAQSDAVELASRRRLSQFASETSVLQQLRRDLTAVDSDPIMGLESGGLFATSTIRGSNAVYTVIWPKARYTAPVASEPPPTDLRIAPLNGQKETKIVGDSRYELPSTIVEFRRLADTWISDWQRQQKETDAILQSLKTDSPEIWSYWDFLYFSAITQFTVGYGDILPNSTLVRLVVMLQICIAAALLVVVINVAFVTGKS
jgi:Ion channel